MPADKRRMALVTWVAIYPTITLLLAAFGPQLEALPLPLRTLLLTAVLVPLMVFVLVPRVKAAADRAFPVASDRPRCAER